MANIGNVTIKIADLEPVRKRFNHLINELHELRNYASGHHSQEDSCVWLHALTVDIPAMIDKALEDYEELR